MPVVCCIPRNQPVIENHRRSAFFEYVESKIAEKRKTSCAEGCRNTDLGTFSHGVVG